MADQYVLSMMDATRRLSFDHNALLTASTFNALNFPTLATSGISDTSGNSRTTSFIFDSFSMSDSMTESFCSTGGGQDETIPVPVNHTNGILSDISTSNNMKIEKKDLMMQKKRRSRKSLFDESIDIIAFDKIESVYLNDELAETDDTWLCEVPRNGQESTSSTDNIFSWVHQEFKTNDIKASKHRLLCKLDDMSHARAIRSVSCHTFADNQKLENVKRSLTEQQVNAEPVKNGRLSSPLYSRTPLLKENTNTRPVSPLRPNIKVTNVLENPTSNVNMSDGIRSRDISKDRERAPLDFTDLEVMAKLQLENLRQAERQGPLFKRFESVYSNLTSIMMFNITII